ncbi:MAG: hypothetical protein AAGI03_04675, partial [Pseudomonadota bacterium]
MYTGSIPVCPSPVKLGHYIGRERGTWNGTETAFRRDAIEESVVSLLKRLAPARETVVVAKKMFQEI